MLMVKLHKPEEALACLMRFYPMAEDGGEPFRRILEQIYRDPLRPDSFALWHYTDVMLLLAEKHDPRADHMAKALFGSANFTKQLTSDTMQYHPWQLILWNISRWNRTHGSLKASETQAEQAVNLCCQRPENITWQTFAISILSDRWLFLADEGQEGSIARIWAERYDRVLKNAAQPIRDHFAIDGERPTRAELERLRRAHLK